MRSVRCLVATLVLSLAPGVGAAQEPALDAPVKADSSPAAGRIHGRILANRQSMDGRLAGGLVSGFFLGLIGTAIAVAVASGDATPLPDEYELRILNAQPATTTHFVMDMASE